MTTNTTAQALDLARACVAYDDAIRACANDPARMTSFSTAAGDDLDGLYFAWAEKARALIAGQGEVPAAASDNSGQLGGIALAPAPGDWQAREDECIKQMRAQGYRPTPEFKRLVERAGG